MTNWIRDELPRIRAKLWMLSVGRLGIAVVWKGK